MPDTNQPATKQDVLDSEERLTDRMLPRLGAHHGSCWKIALAASNAAKARAPVTERRARMNHRWAHTLYYAQ